MPRPRCLRCDNTGQVTEYWLIWKKLREFGQPPAKCARKVDSQEEGLLQMGLLGAEEFDAAVLTGARKCICRVAVGPPVASPAKRMPERGSRLAAMGERDDQ